MANILYRGAAAPTVTNSAGANNGPLTNDQIDKNFYALDSAKFEKSGGTVSGDTTFSTNVTISGNLTINGTTTTINTATLSVDDINVVLGDVASPSDVTANGGGITLKGQTDKTITWDSTNSNWTSSEHWNIASGKSFKIANTSVLNGTTLGSAVINSSLTKLGTTAGFVKSDASGNLSSDTTSYLSGTVGISNGGTNITSYAAGDILYASAANTLSKLAKGTDGQVLKLASGFPTWGTDNDTVYSLPLAANGTRGGVQIGYTATGKNYAVQLDGEKMYVNVPWTDTDTNTWQANTNAQEGYVASGANQANKVWKTDASGNPAWRDDADTNTWNANTKDVAGYVSAPGAIANKVWKTDASGNPGWRDDADTDTNTTYSAGTGLTLTGTSFSVNYGTTSVTACAGNDSRLSDARTPTAHTHAYLSAESDTLSTVTGRGASTSTACTFTGGMSFGTGFTTLTLKDGSGVVGVNNTKATVRVAEAVASPVTSYAAGYSSGGIFMEVQNGDVGGLYVGTDACTIWNAADSGYLFRVVEEDDWQAISPNQTATDPGTTVTADTAVKLILTDVGNLKISGAFTAAGNVTAYSDARLKENITKIDDALDKVNQLNGYTYNRIDLKGARQTGVIAQEVLKVLPEAVEGNDEEKYTVAYGNMVGLLIEAIKELNAKVEDLQNQLANK